MYSYKTLFVAVMHVRLRNKTFGSVHNTSNIRQYPQELVLSVKISHHVEYRNAPSEKMDLISLWYAYISILKFINGYHIL